MDIKKRTCRGYVVDVSDGHIISDGYILQVDVAGRELSRFLPKPDREWQIALEEACVSIKFVFSGYSPKTVRASTLLRSNVRVKLLPDGPVGYIGRVDVRPGDTINLRVHSPREWRILLYRHGLDKKMIIESGPYPPILQEVPDSSFVKEGLEWEKTVSLELPSSLSSGLFSVSITDTSDQCFIFPLVVAPPVDTAQYQADFVVFANTNTWQAYNIWGGKSRYRNFDKDPFNGGVPLPITQERRCWPWSRIKIGVVRRVFRFWRYLMRTVKGSSIRVDVSGIRLEPRWITDPLSVLRPMPNRWLNAESPYSCYLDHLAANEWRALAWLERERFSYHYLSDQQLHMGEIDFSMYRGVVLIGHAEYWSREMYEKLRLATIEQDVPLVNLSGNAIYQEIRFTDDGGIKPEHGDFFETCLDSSKVLCSTTDLAVSGFAPFELSAKSHWALDGVQSEDDVSGRRLLGVNSLIDLDLALNQKKYDPLAPGLLRGDMYGQGASGWEVDKMTSSCQTSALVLARGLNKKGGADMTLIEKEDGRFLFSAPSIAYVSSLLVDKSCSQLTRNIFVKIAQ